MEDSAETNVSQFYSSIGWETIDDVTEDARRFEDLRECAREYVSKCRLRVLNYIPRQGEYLLDMASGPIQYKEYLEYSKNFKKRYCVDLSKKALEIAKKRIGDHGVYLHGSFFDIDLDNDYFDCTISLHTIYHMNKNKQEEAVRKLIDVTKPGKNVIIVYSNPHTLLLPLAALRFLLNKLLPKKKKSGDSETGLYFFAFPIRWWYRFTDVAEVQILPWRSLNSDDQKLFIPDNDLGKKMFKVLFHLEDQLPQFFVQFFQYPMIVLTKK